MQTTRYSVAVEAVIRLLQVAPDRMIPGDRYCQMGTIAFVNGFLGLDVSDVEPPTRSVVMKALLGRLLPAEIKAAAQLEEVQQALRNGFLSARNQQLTFAGTEDARCLSEEGGLYLRESQAEADPAFSQLVSNLMGLSLDQLNLREGEAIRQYLNSAE